MMTLQEMASIPTLELMERALEVKLRHRGDRFSLCSIINVKSGGCSEDCRYCAQSARHRTGAPRYPTKPVEEVVEAARRARRAGAQRFSLVASGRGITPEEARRYIPLIQAVQEEVGLPVCASLGIAGAEALALLKGAGLRRYHHNLETAPSFFPQVTTTHTFEERVATIRAAKEVGLEVCSGAIFGLGETMEQRFELASILAELKVDSIPLNFLIPIAGTPMEGRPLMEPDEALRTIALFRLLLPRVALRVCGGREHVLGEFQALAFQAGADAMMVGGYLTVGGAEEERDRRLVEATRRLWQGLLRA